MRLKNISILLTWSTIVSLPISFSISAIVGDVEIFSTLGLIRNIWIMFLFSPIALVTLYLGFYLKKRNLKYKPSMFSAIICLPLLLIFGSYRLIFSDVIQYDDSNVRNIEDRLNIELPDNLKVATQISEEYVLTYAQISDVNAKGSFEETLINDESWNESLNSALYEVLPSIIQYEVRQFDFYLVFNETTNSFTYDSFSDEEFNLIFISYEIENSRFIMLNDYTVNIAS